MSLSVTDTGLPPQGVGLPDAEGLTAWSAMLTRIMILDERKSGLVRLSVTQGDLCLSVVLDADSRAHLRNLLADGAPLEPVPMRGL